MTITTMTIITITITITIIIILFIYLFFQVLKCGFRIGGGIDQDFMKSPQGYTDNGIYCTEVRKEGRGRKKNVCI